MAVAKFQAIKYYLWSWIWLRWVIFERGVFGAIHIHTHTQKHRVYSSPIAKTIRFLVPCILYHFFSVPSSSAIPTWAPLMHCINAHKLGIINVRIVLLLLSSKLKFVIILNTLLLLHHLMRCFAILIAKHFYAIPSMKSRRSVNIYVLYVL